MSSDRTVVVLGAGATKACGGPLTAEILPLALKHQDIMHVPEVKTLDRLLCDLFRMPPCDGREEVDFPPLPLLLSLIDTAIDKNEPLGTDWKVDDLRTARAGADFAIMKILEIELRSITGDPHSTLVKRLQAAGQEPLFISLNYDVIIDNAIIRVHRSAPDYHIDAVTPEYQRKQKVGALLKIHGSLNWLFDPVSYDVEIGLSPTGYAFKSALGSVEQATDLPRVDADLFLMKKSAIHDRRGDSPSQGLRPVLITPTMLKDYRNPHIARVWYEAERKLRTADRAVFIGYSLPADDLQVVYLLKRGLAHLPPDRITVVEYEGAGRDHFVRRNYAAVFGRDIDWQPKGFEGWLNSDASRCVLGS